MSRPGTEQNPLRVAIVGSGPSGFYAAEALFKSDHTVTVDMIERLPAPFGLVRNGVAPDHPKLKQPIQVYDKIAQTQGFNFVGNVTVGRDVTVEELSATHHAILFTCGAETDRRLGVPGEDLPGSHTATEFVGWYNGHPDFQDRVFDLGQEVAVVIGQGNVAADVARMLAKSADELATTDITQHALEALAASRVREIHVIGRRGPAQAKFTSKELRELGELANCSAIVDPLDLRLNSESVTELADKNNYTAAKNVELFQSWAASPVSDKARRIVFHFLASPVELRGEGRLERLVLERNRLEGAPFAQVARGTGERFELACGLLFRSVGYRGMPIPGVPFDHQRCVFPNDNGRVVGASGLYAAGWIKRGPTGIIGTNRADAVATVATLLGDLEKLDPAAKPGADGLHALLARRGIKVVNYRDWQRIDAQEIERGKPKDKPREKFTRVEEMLAALG